MKPPLVRAPHHAFYLHFRAALKILFAHTNLILSLNGVIFLVESKDNFHSGARWRIFLFFCVCDFVAALNGRIFTHRSHFYDQNCHEMELFQSFAAKKAPQSLNSANSLFEDGRTF